MLSTHKPETKNDTASARDDGCKGELVDAKPGPSPTKARSGNLGKWESGNLESWDPTNMQNMEILKIKILSAQNVGKVLIDKETHFLALFHAIPVILPVDRKTSKFTDLFEYFPWWSNGCCLP